ncbi:MAG: HD domain-containing protein [Desulfovibrionaceae bacterium]|nr:HD domain-containing protein [Desulfovibrionaceae bacterium]
MHAALKVALAICKNLQRNGYDAHVINPSLQERLLTNSSAGAVDLACEPDFEHLAKLYPHLNKAEAHAPYFASLEEDGQLCRFYGLEMSEAGQPEISLLRITPTIVQSLSEAERKNLGCAAFCDPEQKKDKYAGFELNYKKPSDAPIRLAGIPDETLRHDYLLAVRALRFAANYEAEIEPNTWLAIVRSSGRVLDYVPARDIMQEWRNVAAESMHRFVKLMYDAHILQGLVPEVAALSSIPQTALCEDGDRTENVFTHTLECMKYYAEEDFHYDWLGVMAMLFHDVGKLFTCEYFDGKYTFYQHHRVGAKVTRKILQRLHFDFEDIDLICHLVANHMRFHFMMTDRGIRKFKALEEYPRLIAMAKADIKAREDKYTSFNHNMKYLARAETPEQMLEPLLNGNEIMKEINLAPGPLVGSIRDALLKAQISGDVTDRATAVAFVKKYAERFND